MKVESNFIKKWLIFIIAILFICGLDILIFDYFINYHLLENISGNSKIALLILKIFLKLVELSFFIIINKLIFKQKVYFDIKINKKQKIFSLVLIIIFIGLAIISSPIKDIRIAILATILSVVTLLPQIYFAIGIVVGKTLHLLKNNKSYWPILLLILFSSIIFGLLNINNIFSQSESMILNQLLRSLQLVVVISAIYISNANLYIPIFLSFLINYYGLVIMGLSNIKPTYSSMISELSEIVFSMFIVILIVPNRERVNELFFDKL